MGYRYPTVTVDGGFFSRKTIQARPDELLILDSDLGSDRLRHVQYADVVRVSLGRTFGLLWMLGLVLVGIIALGFLMSGDLSRALPFLAPFGLLFAWGMVRGVTVLVIERRGKSLVFSSYLASKRKMRNLHRAVLANVEKVQGASAIPLTQDWLRREEPPASAQIPVGQDKGDVHDNLLLGKPGGLGEGEAPEEVFGQVME